MLLGAKLWLILATKVPECGCPWILGVLRPTSIVSITSREFVGANDRGVLTPDLELVGVVFLMYS